MGTSLEHYQKVLKLTRILDHKCLLRYLTKTGELGLLFLTFHPVLFFKRHSRIAAASL